MLLNYLYTNFLEEKQFANAVGTTGDELASLIQSRVFPLPSYVYDSKARSTSFVSDHLDDQVYRFHLRGHIAWYRDVTQLGLNSEASARAHFFNRYDEARRSFLTSALGEELQAEAPEVAGRFDADHANSTWDHFLNGVYGVCTRDGRPESVFLKQAGVFFIEHLIAECPDMPSACQIDLLGRAVEFLDEVESEFAPHEVPKASRQRCIVDVRARFFDKKAA